MHRSIPGVVEGSRLNKKRRIRACAREGRSQLLGDAAWSSTLRAGLALKLPCLVRRPCGCALWPGGSEMALPGFRPFEQPRPD